MADSPRALVWDPQGDWVKFGFERVRTLRELLRRLLETTEGQPARLSFKGAKSPGNALFAAWAREAFRWGRLAPAAIVCEELAWVSNAGKAPDGWHELVTGGLKYGIDVVSITQRPTEADKTSLSQSLVLYCFQVERPDEQKRLAGELGVDVEKVAALEPLDYLMKDRRTRTLKPGRLTF